MRFSLVLVAAAGAAGYFYGRSLAADDLAAEQDYGRPQPLRLRLDIGDGEGFTAWRETSSLATAAEGDRVFELDRATGGLRFGDGAHGAQPPVDGSVRVEYRAGGGNSGNHPD
jgi:hypothetical protein